MIPVAEAVARVVTGFKPVGTERIALADALGRVLAEDVSARLTQPPADVSAMDGYAVRAADVARPPVALRLIGESAAGVGFAGRVEAGQAVRIFTGAPVPLGADAIVIQEDTEAGAGTVKVLAAAPPGRFIRPAGLDFKRGDVLLGAGRVLTARDVGLAAAMNVPWLTVRRRPRIAILATGNELVMPGEPVGPAQIVNSNSLALAAYVRVLGGDPTVLGIARDDEASLRAFLELARGADLLVSIGGASVGDYDLVEKVLRDEGLALDFHKVAMRPGKPMIFGALDGVPVLGLPGNPVSAGVTTVIFIRPAMARMLALADQMVAPASATLGRDLGENDRRQDYLRAALSRDAGGALVATPFERQDSSMFALFAKADCLVVRPPLAPPIKAGSPVEIIPLAFGLSTF